MLYNLETKVITLMTVTSAVKPCLFVQRNLSETVLHAGNVEVDRYITWRIQIKIRRWTQVEKTVHSLWPWSLDPSMQRFWFWYFLNSIFLGSDIEVVVHLIFPSLNTFLYSAFLNMLWTCNANSWCCWRCMKSTDGVVFLWTDLEWFWWVKKR